jgi:hypothetical protein
MDNTMTSVAPQAVLPWLLFPSANFATALFSMAINEKDPLVLELDAKSSKERCNMERDRPKEVGIVSVGGFMVIVCTWACWATRPPPYENHLYFYRRIFDF